ncbi:hypothetical protein COOONC_15609 [Cooperia oncophora]
MLGCCVTSVSFSKSRAKLVKIEGGDERQLLSGSRSSSQPFKRSFSWERDYMRNARERQQRSEESSFKRTASMPNFSKKQRKAAQRKLADRSSHEVFSSTSNITETTQTGKYLIWLDFTSHKNVTRKGRIEGFRICLSAKELRCDQPVSFSGSINTLEWNQSRRPPSAAVPPARSAQSSALPAVPKLKSALKTPQQSRKSVNIDDSDVTYECLPCDASAGVSSLSGGRPASTLRTYDPVYEQIGQENYLEPNSVRLRSNLALNIDQDKKALLPTQPLPGSSQSIPTANQKTTVIDDVVKPSSLVDVRREGVTQTDPKTSAARMVEEKETTELFRRAPARIELATPTAKPKTPSRVDKPPLSIRDFGVSLTPKTGFCDIETTFDSAGPSSVSSSSHIKYTELEKGPDGRRPVPSTPLKYISVERSSVDRLRELAARPSTSIDHPTTSNSNDSFDVLRLAKAGIAINTFGDRVKQRSITNLTFLPRSHTGASEVFERPDSMTGNLVRGLVGTAETSAVAAANGSSKIAQSHAGRDGTDSYARDAEIRLNLFMNDVVKDETTV